MQFVIHYDFAWCIEESELYYTVNCFSCKEVCFLHLSAALSEFIPAVRIVIKK